MQEPTCIRRFSLFWGMRDVAQSVRLWKRSSGVSRHRSRIQILVDSIVPGMPKFDPNLPPEVCLAQAVEANVRWTIQQLQETPEAQKSLESGQIKLVGAIYEIMTGRVRFLE